uniref:CYRIA/CYRIB Rac1 binding domain-containing protein n=1 Tax=Globisporangium ultimum (strain ATCC 200006 / CBS 805.95 / DAOM BR144) TaxID=431595 RepID=K3WBL4_GLOUD
MEQKEPSNTAISPTPDALHELRSRSCAYNGRHPCGGCDGFALSRLSFAGPRAQSDENAHECALGFMFADEMKVVRQLQRKYEEGRRLVKEIYCARSCARTFPPVAPDGDGESSQAHTIKYNMAIFTVLQPQVEKIKVLSDYCSQTVVMLSDNIQRITVHENTTRVIPDVLMDALLNVMDIVLQLNQLHDTKSSLRNDFSVFKRAFAHVREHIQDADQVEKDIQRLQDFVGNPSQSKGSIWDSLRHNLTNVKRFDQVVYLLLKHCLSHIEDEICVEPDQKFKFIRVLPNLLSVLEESRQQTKPTSNKAAEKKAMDAAVRVLQRFPVVPMFAEVTAIPIKAFSSPNGSKLDTYGENQKSLDASFDLRAVSIKMKSTCAEYLPRLTLATLNANAISSIEHNAVLYGTILEGLQHMSEWKGSFHLFIALKYQNPKSNEAIQQMGLPLQSRYLEYERVTKYNFVNDEMAAMIDIIYCIKSVAQAMQRSLPQATRYIQQHIYRRTQLFVQHTVLPILHRAHKRKLVCSKTLHEIRMMCGDWEDCKSTVDDFIKKRKDRKFPEVNNRNIAPSLCQVHMIGTLINSIYAKRSMGELNAKQSATSSLFSFKKDLDSSDIDLLQQFYRDARVFPYLLSLSETLTDLGDFSSMWFRELYLETTRSTQFPIDTSLPWLLMEYCLQEVSAFGPKPAISILDIYNDAANCSLYQLKQQVLYDEAEAEGKLCFDQLVFMLSDQMYAYYKTKAKARVYSNKRGQYRISSMSWETGNQENTLYEWLTDMKSIDVLGEKHNLAYLLGQHIHLKLMKDLEKWMFKLESSEIASVLELHNSLRVLKSVHAMLSTIVCLNDFEDMLQDVDAQVSLPGDETIYDVVEEYAEAHSEEVMAKQPNPASTNEISPSRQHCESDDSSHREYFGVLHVKVFLELLLESQVLDVADECIKFVEAKIEDVLQLCIPALGSAIPPFRFPRFMYRTEGCYGFFEGKFKYVLDSEELEAQVFHCLREIGNGLCFLLLLSDAMDEQISSFAHVTSGAAAPDASIAKEWHASPTSCPEKMPNASSFYHVWNALEFLSCTTRNDVSAREQFGDGVQFAGCTIIHLLRQRSMYNLWNVSQHVVNVHLQEQTKVKPVLKTASSKKSLAEPSLGNGGIAQSVGTLGQEMKDRAASFVANALEMRKTSSKIFHIIETSWPSACFPKESVPASASSAPCRPPVFVPPTL